MMTNKVFLLITILLFFGVLVPIIHAQNAQTAISNQFCTNVGGADSKQNPCAQTTGNLIFYCQGDRRWRTHPYACESMLSAGCGPTSMAMVLSAFGGTMTPDQVADLYTNAGFYVCGANGGSDMAGSLRSASFKAQLGIEVADAQLVSNGQLNLELAKQYLDPSNGYLIIGSSANFVGCGGCGHIFVVQAADPTAGTVQIRDPNNCNIDGVENTSKITYQANSIGGWLYAFAVRKTR